MAIYKQASNITGHNFEGWPISTLSADIMEPLYLLDTSSGQIAWYTLDESKILADMLTLSMFSAFCTCLKYAE